MHLAIGDARCSLESAVVADGPTSFHIWNDTVLPNPFSNGTNITAAILYNSNYLALNGDNPATVRQGAQYEDAGAAAFDGATIASNATDLDTAAYGTYEIHYNATKDCGLLDTAIRTVEVTDATGPVFASAALSVKTGRDDNHILTSPVHASAADLSKIYASDAGQASEIALAGAAFDSAAPNLNSSIYDAHSGTAESDPLDDRAAA